MATVTYSVFYEFFLITNGEATLADLATAKGSAIAEGDKIYVATGTSKGILGIADGQSVETRLYVGYTRSAGLETVADSVGQLKLYGGSKFTAPVTAYPSEDFIRFNPGFGELVTESTDAVDYAEIDMNETPNTAIMGAAFDCEHLKITNVKSGNSLDWTDATGTILFLTISGKTGASYINEGIPGDGFIVRGCDLGRAVSGLFTEDGLYDIDFVTDAALQSVEPSQPTSFGAVAIPGRGTSRLYPGAISPASFRLQIRITDGYDETVLKNLQALHTLHLPFLMVLRSHGTSKDYPIDFLGRARLVNPLQPFPEGIDYRDLNIIAMEDS